MPGPIKSVSHTWRRFLRFSVRGLIVWLLTITLVGLRIWCRARDRAWAGWELERADVASAGRRQGRSLTVTILDAGAAKIGFPREVSRCLGFVSGSGRS
jgi:hypothetical protein